MIRVIFLAIATIILATGCAPKKQPELKSPCVAADSNQADHPCARRPVNTWLS